jgi:purine-binding chemotaxis protein CheW
MAAETAPYVEPKIAQFIVFRLAGEDFGIPIGDVREIIRGMPLTPVPGTLACVKGLINVRGEIAAVIDLTIRFGLPVKKRFDPKHLVITAQGKNLFALMVDEVTEVLRIAVTEIKSAPDVSAKMEPSAVTGIVTRGGRLIILLDLAKALAEESLGLGALRGKP